MHTAVKQIEMAYRCPRRYAGHYKLGFPFVQSSEASEGDQVHKQVKCYGEGLPGAHPPESRVGKMAAALFQHVDEPTPGLFEIQGNVYLPEDDLTCELRCDYFWHAPDENYGIARDWKTTGAKSPKAKLENGKFWTLQSIVDEFEANIYSHLIFNSDWGNDLEFLAFHYVYVSKKFEEGNEPKTWPVSHVFRPGPTREWWAKYVRPTLDLMRDIQSTQLDNLRDVPHNRVSCEGSGKWCDVAGRCRMVPSPVMKYSELSLPVFQERKQ